MKPKNAAEKFSSFLALAKARVSTYEFNKELVTEKDVLKILEAGRWAPSCSNLQPWHFIVVKNHKRIKELMMCANYGDFHTDPPLLIALVLLQRCCPTPNFSCFPVDLKVNDAFMCLGMAALSMAFEAQDLGVDSCFLTPLQAEAKKILRVSGEDTVPLILGLGHSRQGAFQKPRARKELSEIISYEHFRGKK